MSYTEKQKAYHLRKMKTRIMRLDYNQDGYISREDYDLMARKLAEYSEMTDKQAESTYKEFMKIADALNLRPGLMISLEKATQNASRSILCMAPDERKAHNLLFDAIDTNKDGHLSLEEFKVYIYVIAPESSEADIVSLFNSINVDKNGKISRKEFLSAAEDFLSGVEETEISEAFYGQLLDDI